MVTNTNLQTFCVVNIYFYEKLKVHYEIYIINNEHSVK